MPGVLLAIAYTALLLYFMRRMPFFAWIPGLRMRTVAGLFSKIMAGTALWAVYTYLYTDRTTADIFKYFDDSAVLYGALWQHPGDLLRIFTGISNDSPYFDAHYYGVMNNWVRRFENNVYNDSHHDPLQYGVADPLLRPLPRSYGLRLFREHHGTCGVIPSCASAAEGSVSRTDAGDLPWRACCSGPVVC